MKKNLLFLVLLGVIALSLPNLVFGQTITGMVANVAKVVWIVATIMVLIFWVITGILFLSSMGDPSKLSKAKLALFASIGGTVIVIIAYSAMTIIGNAILNGA